MERDMYFLIVLSLFVVITLGQNSSHEVNKQNRDLLRRSKRRWVLSTIELEEEDPGPFPKVATQMFNDQHINYNLKFHISGEGVDEKSPGTFTINENNGTVYVHKSIDREQYSNFHVRFDVVDRKTDELVDKTLAFDVTIHDKNDNAPAFEAPNQSLNVKENTKEGDLQLSLLARDIDEEGNDNSRITMRVVSQDPASPKISLKEVEGTKMSQLTFTGCFDYDKEKTYKVIVEARDHGTPSLSASSTITLNIVDSNTHQPEFKETSYTAQVMEMAANEEILRVGVMDKDTPNTPASKAKYTILKGNEEGYYKIETDPVTNEGVLTVIKGKDFEKMTLVKLEIAVENEEPLFVCGAGGVGKPAVSTSPRTVNVDVKVIDINDPPEFEKKEHTVYQKEETNPGQELYKPKATDVDSDDSKIRYELAEDVAQWMTIDKKTGVVTTAKKMDRESPHVHNNIYKVLVKAVDDGTPPATATSTLLVHLGDANDNGPYLVTKSPVMCGNKVDHVNVMAADRDAAPFGGPFSFSLGGEDKTIKNRWKLDPNTGYNATLVSLRSLPYGNYSVPLRIEEQQGQVAEEVLHLVVCDCGGGDECRGLLPRSTKLAGAAIGILVAGFLLLALLLCICLLCECGEKRFKHLPLNLQDEGNQTLIKYNEEGGSSACKAEPTLVLTPTSSIAVKDVMKQAAAPLTQVSSNGFKLSQTRESLRGPARGVFVQQVAKDSSMVKSQGRGMAYQNWNMSRTNTVRSETARLSRTFSLLSDWNLADHIDRRIYVLGEDQLEYPGCHLHEYAYEGEGSKCQSLDELSLSNCGEDLDFLQNLGPKFNNLGWICREVIEENNLKV